MPDRLPRRRRLPNDLDQAFRSDGQRDAPLAALRVGATWSWQGEPVRVDGPASVLQLGDSDIGTDVRARAARMVRRLVGLLPRDTAPAAAGDETHSGESGFTVTDGRRGYSVTLIPAATVPRICPPPCASSRGVVEARSRSWRSPIRGDALFSCLWRGS